MFQFPGCPTYPYVFWIGYAGIPQHGFPHSDVSGSSRLHTPDRSFSQCPTSFFGTDCQGILHTPLLAFFSRLVTSCEYRELDFSCFRVNYARSFPLVYCFTFSTLLSLIRLLRCFVR
jgi:hypothetical protein